LGRLYLKIFKTEYYVEFVFNAVVKLVEPKKYFFYQRKYFHSVKKMMEIRRIYRKFSILNF